MTSRPIRKTPATRSADRFPEFPPRDDMQNSIYLDAPAHQAALSHHFGRPDTTIVLSEVPIGRTVRQRQGLRVPDLLVRLRRGTRRRHLSARLFHRGAGQTAGLRTGSGVRDHGAERLYAEAGRLRPPSAYRSTGGSTHQAANTTTPPWPADKGMYLIWDLRN